MKKHLILSACLIMAISSFAQKKDFSYKFYGQIRTDLYYNSRANEETVDGLFYMYPKEMCIRDRVDSLLASDPAIESRTMIAGYSFIAGQGPSYGSFICKMKNWDERSIDVYKRQHLK